MSDIIRTITFLDEIAELLLSAPTPAQIAEFQLSDIVQQRVRYLLEANRNGVLTTDERNELDELGRWEHVMTVLK